MWREQLHLVGCVIICQHRDEGIHEIAKLGWADDFCGDSKADKLVSVIWNLGWWTAELDDVAGEVIAKVRVVCREFSATFR